MRLLKPKKYNPGSNLIRYGDRPDKLYILIDGGVDIKIAKKDNNDDDKDETVIHRTDFGFLIGDAVASKDDDKRDADVNAGKEGLTVLEIEEESIKKLEEKT